MSTAFRDVGGSECGVGVWGSSTSQWPTVAVRNGLRACIVEGDSPRGVIHRNPPGLDGSKGTKALAGARGVVLCRQRAGP